MSLKPLHKRTLEQIHAAGGAQLWRDGWTVNGWEGKGAWKLGPDRRTMAHLIDQSFLVEVASQNKHFRKFEVSVFGRAAARICGQTVDLGDGKKLTRFPGGAT